MKILAKLGRLQELEFIKTPEREEIKDELVKDLATHCRNLTTLRLSNCADISNGGVKMLAKLSHLKVLAIDGCEKVTDNAVKELAESCTSLTSLYLSKSQVSDHGVKLLLAKLDRLEELGLSQCFNVSDQSIIELVKYCTNLKFLNVAYCRKVTVDSVLAFRNNASKRKVCLRLYIPDSGIRMKFEDGPTLDKIIFIHPLLKIVSSM